MATSPSTESSKFFMKLNKITYILGLPNLWIGGVEAPTIYKKVQKGLRYLVNLLIVLLMMCEWGAHFTQPNLTERQVADRIMFGFSHPTLFTYVIVFEYYQERISKILFDLVVDLKNVYNDRDVEQRMISKAKYNTACFLSLVMMALIFYGYDGITQVIRGEGTFTTLITFWPDVNESSLSASIARLATYLMWWIFMFRVCAVFIIVIPTIVCLSHQFKNLQSYFYSLENIFEEDVDQIEMEKKYVNAVKVGIRMHAKTLGCTEEIQIAFNVILSNHVLTAVAVLVLLMSQMTTSERTLESVLSTVTTGSVILISTGFFIWNAGDVTVEAADLATAMYSSGWARCHSSSPRVRRLLAVTMLQAQKPVILFALGIVELSYESYVAIVKSSYSVFSVLF